MLSYFGTTRFFPSSPITDDPATWLKTKLSESDRISIVSKGPVPVCDFPLNDETPKHRFTVNNYYLNLDNNEKVRRT